ncbi:hypothetical protein MNBD_NITROSPINAE02-1308 [hydrothermal vent metagenome]|uniref:Uncharacterized protein n=1 Tax=hydrothermal vent metagenome TaxID=652676 RepID=A0A3B1CJR0_9ZZZZ
MNRNSGIIASVLFLIILAFPLYYNVFAGAPPAPEIKVDKPGKCIAETSWMRSNHMKMLMHTRDNVVREGFRETNHGIQGCRSCHEKRSEFCDKCHEYIGVQPECWNCHNYPT